MYIDAYLSKPYMTSLIVDIEYILYSYINVYNMFGIDEIVLKALKAFFVFFTKSVLLFFYRVLKRITDKTFFFLIRARPYFIALEPRVYVYIY